MAEDQGIVPQNVGAQPTPPPPPEGFDPNTATYIQQLIQANLEATRDQRPYNRTGRSLMTNFAPPTGGYEPAIRVPDDITAAHFDLKASTIQMAQTHCPFSGKPDEDPNEFIGKFNAFCTITKYNGVPPNTLKLHLFQYVLTGRAKEWLDSQPPGSITTWDQCMEEFLNKFYPASRSIKAQGEILTFHQRDGETVTEAWERFMKLVRRCPNHGFPEHTIVMAFYQGLDRESITILNREAGGNFAYAVDVNGVHQLMKQLIKQDSHLYDERRYSASSSPSDDKLDKLTAVVTNLVQHVYKEKKTVAAMEDPEIEAMRKEMELEEAKYVGAQRQNWNNSYQTGATYAPGFQHKTAPPAPPAAPQSAELSDLKAMMMTMGQHFNNLTTQVASIATDLQSTKTSLRTLEVQVGHIATQLSARAPGSLPSDTEPPHQVNAITTRSGVSLIDPPYPSHARAEASKAKEHEIFDSEKTPVVSPQSKDTTQPAVEPVKEVLPSPSLSKELPYPLRSRKKKDDSEEYRRFLSIFSSLHVNIPLIEALQKMPSYARFIKDILLGRRTIHDLQKVELNAEVSSCVLHGLPKKQKDPGSFVIEASLGGAFTCKALCDLGASVNLMPLSVFKKLGVGDARPTHITIQLADKSIKRACGVVENLLVKVGKFIIPADFVLIDMPVGDVPLILGRPFLATGRTLIDVENGELIMRVNDEIETFRVFKSTPQHSYEFEPGVPFAVQVKRGLPELMEGDPLDEGNKTSAVRAHEVVLKIQHKKREEALRAKPPY